ncbi:DUF6232 family protein [Hyalangium minutum]|uniref:Uncharacterized protein n=1 Tax=Hyalangium minutum TaxID=394096 RepID=A0A085WNX0_9BACT|nr:DUF6232 family protein [Hyalangium minutum]KFE69383.1 hypothetical protein DB31_6358 [Hyalangium minutum]
MSDSEQVTGPQLGQEETLLFNEQGVLVTSERVVASGRTWRVGELVGVGSIRRSPRVLPWLVILVLGAIVGLPVLSSLLVSPHAPGSLSYDVVLALAGTAIFASIAALVVVGDSYWLVLRTRQREGHVLRSRDPQLISKLVTVVGEAAEAARQRR